MQHKSKAVLFAAVFRPSFHICPALRLGNQEAHASRSGLNCPAHAPCGKPVKNLFRLSGQNKMPRLRVQQNRSINRRPDRPIGSGCIVLTPGLCRGNFNRGANQMKTLTTIPVAVAAIIPKYQLLVTKSNLKEFADGITRLETALKKCPKINGTVKMKEHPAIFHYFYGGCDSYICEYNPEEGLMYGYGILNGDLQNSKWGYFSVEEFSNSKFLNIDYHFEEQSIEAALHNQYPRHFKKPQSLEK